MIIVPNAQAFTIDVTGAGAAGFNTGLGIGSITPANFISVPVESVLSSGGVDFIFTLTASLAQNFWRELIVLTTAGVYRRYTSAAATFVAGASTSWQYGAGADRVYAASSPFTSYLLVYY